MIAWHLKLVHGNKSRFIHLLGMPNINLLTVMDCLNYEFPDNLEIPECFPILYFFLRAGLQCTNYWMLILVEDTRVIRQRNLRRPEDQSLPAYFVY